ncbi:hypothetical protein COW36_17950 [bacterium (Candidatus Blackallbacteria) CG17_big_fil_post_rev_8_21_14_2_50_48_46]|uniref:Uncharacterized protein n=1 Tax=bacterium (Candidatus Blackallbacteria) CG17_big_fil_post_rev_8_21_14_2_50_48_46 TaxID=2014261 RepID=A0A2M7G0U1_9BACT|nr:MAG: hypothetical protein COW64_00775 [bacterium (Candidatus Blackallbacteria) CG18_big_fil_WC_8_21_14_2_50_49_26]PIW15299.1 MAG: hypothetical protein COW36_17950 [bacterium (Candidatus Blackallbacteria) CG17_big_fil_post_rev_8_21_14_2_50_48_46]PIW45191.1 MAG: hypothetical protein COW20_21065 [bacterium (Candidatus Blackallbacteria) CG13_big_fil_rev_8_21_14_2_50_49_14]
MKKILLARPHPFLVQEMSQFLLEEGYFIEPLRSFSELSIQVENSSAVIISTAVSATIQESAREVFAGLYKYAIPTIFAGLLGVAQARSLIQEAVQDFYSEPLIVSAESQERELIDARRPFLFICRDDLKHLDSRAKIARLLLRFMG